MIITFVDAPISIEYGKNGKVIGWSAFGTVSGIEQQVQSLVRVARWRKPFGLTHTGSYSIAKLTYSGVFISKDKFGNERGDPSFVRFEADGRKLKHVETS